MLTDWYAYDERIHGELRQRAEAELKLHNTVDQMTQTGGNYHEVELVKSENADEKANQGVERGVKLDGHQWDETVRKLGATFGGRRSGSGRTGFESSPRRVSPVEGAEVKANSKNDTAQT